MNPLADRITAAERSLARAEHALTRARARSEAVTPGGLHGDPATLSGVTRRANAAADARRFNAYDAERDALAEMTWARTKLALLRRKHERAAADAAAPCDVASLRIGDAVRDRHGWHEVRRVNAKSVTVPSIVGGSWTDRVPLASIIETRQAVAS